MLLLDTDILIDCLRGAPAARTWLESAAAEAFAIPGIGAMELLVGCRNQSEQQRVQKFLTAYSLLWPDASELGALTSYRRRIAWQAESESPIA